MCNILKLKECFRLVYILLNISKIRLNFCPSDIAYIIITIEFVASSRSSVLLVEHLFGVKVHVHFLVL